MARDRSFTDDPRRDAVGPVRRRGSAAPPDRPAPPDRTPTGRPAAPAGGPEQRVRRDRPAGVPKRTAPPRLAGSRRRLRLATVLALALFTLIGVRLVLLQVAQSPQALDQLLDQQRKRLVEVKLPAPRGSILDRSGAPLARSVEARYVYADPELVTDAPRAARELSPLLGIAPSKLARLLAKQKRPGGGASRFVYLARGVDLAVVKDIAALELAGIGTGRDERREIPGADLAANLIGFTGEDRTGLEGLEARYDDLLDGTDGRLVYERGNPRVDDGKLAKEIPSGYHRLTESRPGTSLQLTIDRDLQFYIQRILGEHLEKVKATAGAAVVLDVRSGEVLAQASFPPFNAAKPLDYEPGARIDVATRLAAEPGSTHKAFMVAAALQEGVVTAGETFPAGAPIVRGGAAFPDDHPQPPGTRLTIPQILAYSSNVGTIEIADRLGAQRVYDWQRRFGLGSVTGEGMPGESAGRLLAPPEWSPSASGSVPIGLSVDATLLQMAAGYAAIANDGTYVTPYLIKATIDPDGTAEAAEQPARRQVLTPEVAAQVRTMLEAPIVMPKATGARAAVPGHRVAGKTGTVDRLVDGQYTSANRASFIGMAPADHPRYVVAISAEVPDGAGGEIAAPIFSQMMGLTLRTYRVPPS